MDIFFKNRTIEYITGNSFESQTGERNFIDCKITQNDLYTKLSEKGITPNNIFAISNEQTTNFLVYGTYTENSANYGFIVVLDQAGNVLDIITTYDTGTKISPIITLNYDEDGIYGIDYTNNKYRVILLNNVALDSPRGYYCKLRASFYINYSYNPPTTNIEGTCPIKKVPGEASYFIFGYANNQTTLIKFTNNVGMENEWYQYFGHSISTDTVNYCDFILETVGETTKAYIYYCLYSDNSTLHYEVFNGASLGSYSSVASGTLISNIAIKDKNSIYIATRGNGYILVWNYSHGDWSLLIEKYYSGSVPYVSLINKNNILFIGVETYDSTKKYIGCVTYENGQLDYSNEYEGDVSDLVYTNFTIQKVFSLYSFVVLGKGTVMRPSTAIYDGMYSGSSYASYGSVSSQKGELYSNGYIVFARPLYNKQIFNNQTTCTLEIPNGYLNGITIDQKNILSKTNSKVLTNTQEIEKNIYESVYLNFNYAFNVIDEDTNTIFPQTANYINGNLNVGTEENYNKSRIGKARINYENYSIMQNITWEYIDSTHYEASLLIDTTDVPFSLDFMSNDETTIYITKELNLEQNKYYVLTQKIRIE